ncbi:MAG: rod-binding protein [Vulcanimicrobiota bacterium]
MNIHRMTPHSFKKAAEELPSTHKNDAELQKACKEFESLFLNQLLTAMRKTIPKVDGQENNQKQMYESMMDTELAKSWSQSDGIGLANVLYQQLKHNKGT